VLSPQFLLWLLPVAALVAGRRALTALGILVAACIVTRGWFPDRYRLLADRLDSHASWLVLLRDVLLAGLLAVFLVVLRARSGSARSRSLGPTLRRIRRARLRA
jgi:hypothetical protein